MHYTAIDKSNIDFQVKLVLVKHAVELVCLQNRNTQIVQIYHYKSWIFEFLACYLKSYLEHQGKKKHLYLQDQIKQENRHNQSEKSTFRTLQVQLVLKVFKL